MSIEDDHYWEEIEKRRITYETVEEIVKREVNDYLRKQLKEINSQVTGWIIVNNVTDRLRYFCYRSLKEAE